MNLGLFTPVFHDLTLDQMLAELRAYPAITALELGTGGWPGASHLAVDSLLDNPAAARDHRARLTDAGLAISALSCHGNPIHPVAETAQRDDETFRKTVRLAEQLEVPTVVTFSGCPGASSHDATPNWIVTAWPPEYVTALDWQWSERLIPYWRETAAFAAAHNVRIALEAHPGFMVYNPETLLRLRAETGPSLGINLDPSHLWWQGVDIPTAIRDLGPAIHHVHAKDVALNPPMLNRNGVLDTKSYADLANRSWSFRSVGWGHSELEWKQIVSALRIAGYDGVLSIEHEDALASRREGLTSAVAMLSRVLLTEPPVKAWWL
ncbi:TIM barrel protein [Granulicella sp. 5B5]|uniref:sugar phosphate isomerase/epimerase family protein n=1 Tax=Granulicella sp. 5B5 TaxID=1617967 RepID=UPI0015F60489|nr:sugar phosphate isomerase/epimerase [Granulicella sp. 5B5]QMV18369.1 TIM barrel protein [Granulicella sp. 5B5]